MTLNYQENFMPNFLIIGAAKSGTTALYHYLKQHPQIYMSPVKETEFFALEGEEFNFKGPGDMQRISRSITNIEDYQAQFQKVSNEIAIGEASPVYLYSSKAPERIKHYLPDVKLIAILRDPIERAYSQFLMMSLGGREPISNFTKAIEQEKVRINNNWEWGWRYIELGFYHVQIKRYFELFEENQIKVYLYKDLHDNSDSLLKNIFNFLAVDETFVPDVSVKYNPSGIPKNNIFHNFVEQPNLMKSVLKPLFPVDIRTIIRTNLKKMNLVKPQLPLKVRKEILPIFQDDILKLQDLIQRDLSEWLN